MGPEKSTVKVHWAVKAFVLVHMALVFTWSMPHLTWEREGEFVALPAGEQWSRPVDLWMVKNRQWFKNNGSPTSFYLTSTGLWQSWDMFAPNPADTDVWVDAIVTFEDGSTEELSFYRIYDMPIPQKYVYERFRKYREYFSADDYGWKWPHVSMYMARKAEEAFGKPVELVALRRHWYTIQPPGEEPWEDYASYIFYERYVTREDMAAFEEGTWKH